VTYVAVNLQYFEQKTLCLICTDWNNGLNHVYCDQGKLMQIIESFSFGSLVYIFSQVSIILRVIYYSW